MDHAQDADAARIPDELAGLVAQVEAVLAAGDPEPDSARIDEIFDRLAADG